MADYTILIIDYEPRNVQRLTDTLEGAGFNVAVANDGVSGFRAFERLRPDLTLVEVMLPRRSGLEVCRDLKRTDHGRESLVVMMTSRFRGRIYRSQALHQYGADGYLEKPVPEDQLQAILRELTGEKNPASIESENDRGLDNAVAASGHPNKVAPKAPPPDGETAP